MAFTDGVAPTPTTSATAVTYSTPSHSDLAAVAVTVTVVGILMALLITWLVVRLRRAAQAQAHSIPIVASTVSYTFRPSFAPSEASSKFGFIRKPLRLSRRHEDASWDFADPDPFSHQKESPFDPPVRTPSQKHRPAPLPPTPAYTPRTHKDELTPTPASMDSVEPPPPAHCRALVHQLSPC